MPCDFALVFGYVEKYDGVAIMPQLRFPEIAVAREKGRFLKFEQYRNDVLVGDAFDSDLLTDNANGESGLTQAPDLVL